MKQIIEISTKVELSVINSQLSITGDSIGAKILPIDNIECIIVDNPHTRLSNAFINLCTENNINLILCDDKHLPFGSVIANHSHFTQTKTLTYQLQCSQSLKNKIWKQIISQKISNQATHLDIIGNPYPGLHVLSTKVAPGDPELIEARAAKLYWKCVFGNRFTREPQQLGVNTLLNYGYAIIRSTVTKSICRCGFIPTVGIHHHNQYDPTPLSNDLMEPFRPLIDNIVHSISLSNDTPELTKTSKRELLNIFTRNICVNGTNTTFSNGVQLYIDSFKKAIINNDYKMLSDCVLWSNIQ